MNKSDGTKYPRENKDEHYLVIIDNMASSKNGRIHRERSLISTP